MDAVRRGFNIGPVCSFSLREQTRSGILLLCLHDSVPKLLTAILGGFNAEEMHPFQRLIKSP